MTITSDKLMEYASAIKTYCEDNGDTCEDCPFLVRFEFNDIAHRRCKLDGGNPADWDELEVTR